MKKPLQRAWVVSNADPENRMRLLVRVPGVNGNDPLWAEPCLPPPPQVAHEFYSHDVTLTIPDEKTGVWVSVLDRNGDLVVWLGSWQVTGAVSGGGGGGGEPPPPVAHAATHAAGGTDELTPAAIGAAPTSHNHDDLVHSHPYASSAHEHEGYVPEFGVAFNGVWSNTVRADNASDPTGTGLRDLNTHRPTGVYSVFEPLNSPRGATAWIGNWLYVLHWQHGADNHNFARQEATTLFGTTAHQRWFRQKDNGVWGPWYGDWQAITSWSNNWGPYDADGVTQEVPALLKTPDNVVFAKGLIRNSVNAAAGQVVCNFPAGYRITGVNRRFNLANGTAVSQFRLDPNGDLVMTHSSLAVTDQAWDLSSIQFIAGA